MKTEETLDREASALKNEINKPVEPITHTEEVAESVEQQAMTKIVEGAYTLGWDIALPKNASDDGEVHYVIIGRKDIVTKITKTVERINL